MNKLKYLKSFIVFICFGIIAYLIIRWTPEKSYFSKGDARVAADTLTLIIIFITPLILVPVIYNKSTSIYYFAFIIFGMTGYFLGNKYQNVKSQKELDLTGTITKGIIKKKRFFKPSKGVGYWEFYCEFEDSTFLYNTFYTKDIKNKYFEGDSLDILYLKRNPEISRLVLKKDD